MSWLLSSRDHLDLFLVVYCLVYCYKFAWIPRIFTPSFVFFFFCCAHPATGRETVVCCFPRETGTRPMLRGRISSYPPLTAYRITTRVHLASSHPSSLIYRHFCCRVTVTEATCVVLLFTVGVRLLKVIPRASSIQMLLVSGCFVHGICCTKPTLQAAASVRIPIVESSPRVRFFFLHLSPLFHHRSCSSIPAVF